LLAKSSGTIRAATASPERTFSSACSRVETLIGSIDR